MDRGKLQKNKPEHDKNNNIETQVIGYRKLQNFIAFLFTTTKSFIDIPILESFLHVNKFGFLHEMRQELQDRTNVCVWETNENNNNKKQKTTMSVPTLLHSY